MFSLFPRRFVADFFAEARARSGEGRKARANAAPSLCLLSRSIHTAGERAKGEEEEEEEREKASQPVAANRGASYFID